MPHNITHNSCTTFQPTPPCHALPPGFNPSCCVVCACVDADGADAEMDAADEEEVPAHAAAPAAQQIGAAPAEAAAAANVAAHQAAAQQAAAQQALLVQQVAQLQLHMQEAQPAAQQLQT